MPVNCTLELHEKKKKSKNGQLTFPSQVLNNDKIVANVMAQNQNRATALGTITALQRKKKVKLQ